MLDCPLFWFRSVLGYELVEEEVDRSAVRDFDDNEVIADSEE